MVLKLDSRPAIVWRDPFSLQFGIEPVRAILREVTTAEERMITALRAGVSRSGLAMIARSSGVGDPEVASLLARLDDLLAPPADPALPRRVAIVGRGPTVDRIAEALAIAGVQVIVGAGVPDAACDLGIALGHYVLDPESYGFWLRRDLPHLPVVFGDDSVTVGPLVEPGSTACLYCLEHYRRDADASWSAIASQLWGRQGGAETHIASIDATARVSRLVLQRLAGNPATTATSIRIEAATGETTRRVWLPHPECGCVELPSGLNRPDEDRQETSTARDSGPPRKVAAAAARA